MLKAITYTNGVYHFTDHLEQILPQSIAPAQDLPLIEACLKNCLGLAALPAITIGNAPEQDQTKQGLIEKILEKLSSPIDYTDTSSKKIYFRSLTKCLARSVFINRLAHESVHSIALANFPKRPDIYLATTIGNWITYELGGKPGWIGENTNYIGLGQRSFAQKKLDPRITYLLKKILAKPIKDAGLTERKYGYALGNILFELLETAHAQQFAKTDIYFFIQALLYGEDLPKAFSKLLDTTP